jgi:hypothetical protein
VEQSRRGRARPGIDRVPVVVEDPGEAGFGSQHVGGDGCPRGIALALEQEGEARVRLPVEDEAKVVPNPCSWGKRPVSIVRWEGNVMGQGL